MNPKVVICVLAGHRWTEADVHEPFPVLECGRCQRRQKLAPGTQRPEAWTERAGRGARADSFMDGDIQRRP